MRPAPGWRVEVEAHEVARWSIEEQVIEVRAVNETQARIAAARQVARAAGLPPWKPYVRRVYLRCRVLKRLTDLAKQQGGPTKSRSRSADRAPSPRAFCVSPLREERCGW
jgi:hypothetical protein